MTVPSLKPEPKSEPTSFSVSFTWKRPKIKASQSESEKTTTNYPEKYAKPEQIYSTCLAGGFTGPEAKVSVICLALPLISHGLDGFLAISRCSLSSQRERGEYRAPH